MSTLTLPGETVQFYNDGPDWPTTPLLQEAERAYREAYAEGARDVAEWDMPDPEMIDEAWQERRLAKRDAELIVPSAVVFGEGPWRGEQIIYRAGHEVAASRTRGRCHALELAKQLWWDLDDVGVADEEVIETIIKPWVQKVQEWAREEIHAKSLSPPPRPEDFLTEAQNRMLNPTSAPKPEPAPARAFAVTRRLKDVEREKLTWLWPGRIPIGKLTLLAGDPGLGKSFVTLDMAARVSRGDGWPDVPLLKQTPAGVLLFNAEDDLADTIAPRLDKMQADDRNIIAIEGVSLLGERRHFSLESDLPRLAEVLDENPDTKLAVIDPISAYTGKVDSHNNTEVRGLLAPLAELAGRFHLAIVAVTHLSKSGGTKAVYRAMGSLAFAAAARAVWVIAKDQDDPQRRLLLPSKLNLSQDPDGLAYRIKEGCVAWETDPVHMHADDACAAELQASGGKPRGSERREAKEWLIDELAAGRRPSKEIIEYGKECGFSEKTLRRAYAEIGVKPTKESFDGQWLWRLPDEDDQDGQ
jgi:hypothetical protein